MQYKDDLNRGRMIARFTGRGIDPGADLAGLFEGSKHTSTNKIKHCTGKGVPGKSAGFIFHIP